MVSPFLITLEDKNIRKRDLLYDMLTSMFYYEMF